MLNKSSMNGTRKSLQGNIAAICHKIKKRIEKHSCYLLT